VFDLLVESTLEDDEQAESRDPWRILEHHARVLKSHEERLENNITKIEIIREMLEEKKGLYSLVNYKNAVFILKDLSLKGAKFELSLKVGRKYVILAFLYYISARSFGRIISPGGCVPKLL